MKKRHSLGIVLDELYVKGKYSYKTYLNVKYAHKRIKMIGGGYKGSDKEFRDVVLKYWEPYGVKPKKYWYTMYCDGRTAYEPRYIPDTMWYGDILPYFNNLMVRRAYVDKSMYTKILPDLKKPVTVVKNIAGYFFNGDLDQPITREEAVALCKDEEHLIFKPSLDSGGGRSILFYDKETMNEETISNYFDEYGAGFVVQRLVEQHPDLARIHKESLNSIRVMALHFQGEVHILSAQLRMGSGGARVDNYSAGGYSANINPDGSLSEFAVNKQTGIATEHPCGLKFKDIVVPHYDRVIETIKRAHKELPYFNIIGWDFSVDPEGNPVFIEINVTPEPNQIGSGPTFGDLTEEVLKEVFITKSFAGKMN